jgi:phage shock protein C
MYPLTSVSYFLYIAATQPVGIPLSSGGSVLMTKLYLSETDRKIGGVCGGLGEFLDKDPTLIRILFILIILFSFGFGILAYLAMWLVIPKRPDQR